MLWIFITKIWNKKVLPNGWFFWNICYNADTQFSRKRGAVIWQRMHAFVKQNKSYRQRLSGCFWRDGINRQVVVVIGLLKCLELRVSLLRQRNGPFPDFIKDIFPETLGGQSHEKISMLLNIVHPAAFCCSGCLLSETVLCSMHSTALNKLTRFVSLETESGSGKTACRGYIPFSNIFNTSI